MENYKVADTNKAGDPIKYNNGRIKTRKLNDVKDFKDNFSVVKKPKEPLEAKYLVRLGASAMKMFDKSNNGDYLRAFKRMKQAKSLLPESDDDNTDNPSGTNEPKTDQNSPKNAE